MLADRHELVGNRYQLKDELGSGAMGIVYKAYDRLYRKTVALKQVIALFENSGTTVDANSSTSMRLALANEFQVLSSLRHPHIIGVSDYGFHQGQSYYTMQYIESPTTIRQYAQGKSLTDQIRVLVEMLQALQYLHRRGIIHRDLKPDNALVSTEGAVNVLDFGLATVIASKTGEQSISGTIAYMAPEVLQGESISAASDLYAVGVIAYEIFAGHHPFDLKNVGTLIFDIIQKPIDVSAMDVPEEIALIVERLLSKTPEDRYTDAESVINAFNTVTSFDIPNESLEIRESYLQAAHFVGRERELGQLKTALDDVLQNKGSAWLIGGESGVGKSRLIEEIRTLALVQGALVLNGQGVAEGGLSYQMWLNPLRRLILS
jgi:eukaryotic-like serine/threonine-protein kinase